MKFFGFIAKLAVAVLAFGAVASLYLSSSKDDYIKFDNKDDFDLY